ncbi:MAG: transglycosylase domain-containing protein [Defluviitaleaceae bacterium]|nr:transglycosylase domain-containing protein [Defluviitaleaceae bacterium]
MDYSESTNKIRKSRKNPHGTRLRNTVGVMVFRILFAVVLIGGFAAVGAGIGIYLGILGQAPEINVINDLRPGIYTSFIIEARTGEEIARLSGDENRVFVPISQMPQHLLDAFVSIEDERFFTHNGVDIRGMGRALHVNLTSDRVEGASTITQQLIKNILGLHRNDLMSKLQEQYLAVRFEQRLTEVHGSTEIAKEVILEAYLNMINLGRNWHGVQVAAWNYFGKDVSELTISESAVIAAITRNPSRYLPDRFPQNNRYRQVLVLDKMLELEKITERQHREAYEDPVHERVQSGLIAEMASGIVHSYFVDALIEQVVYDLMAQHFITREQAFGWVYGGGLRIYATQDLRAQEIVDEVFKDDSVFPVGIFHIDVEYRMSARNAVTERITNHHRRFTVRNESEVEAQVEAIRAELLTANDTIVAENTILMPQPQAAFVLMEQHNGHVLAISGGRGEKTGNRHFCRATVSTRSPGSQFKIVAAFLPGIDTGVFSAATHFEDAPWYFEDGHSPRYTPRNWWNAWRGWISVRHAIYASANVVSAMAFQEVGPEVAFQYLTHLGFTTLEGTLPNGRPFRDVHASVPLGGLTLGVTQLELAASYATIANLGEYNRPVFYTRVLDHNGRVLLENNHNPTRVIRPATAYLLTDMMMDTVRAGGATGHLARLRAINMPVAGKTGTSQNVHDLGFTGYTPYFTASVWLGFDQPRELRNVNNAHLVIWRQIMERVHLELDLAHRNFERPEGVTTTSICRVTGHLPSDICRRAGTVVSGLAVAGLGPGTVCSGHFSTTMYICVMSGTPASNYCPQELRVRGVPTSWADCHYHRPYTINDPGLPGGGIWGFPDLPGLPGGFDDSSWWHNEQPTHPAPSVPWDLPPLPGEPDPFPGLPPYDPVQTFPPVDFLPVEPPLDLPGEQPPTNLPFDPPSDLPFAPPPTGSPSAQFPYVPDPPGGLPPLDFLPEQNFVEPVLDDPPPLGAELEASLPIPEDLQPPGWLGTAGF